MSKGNNPRNRLWTVCCASLVLFVFVVPLILRAIENNAPRAEGYVINNAVYSEHLFSIDSLLNESELIIIGDIGPILAREYPFRYPAEGYTQAEWDDIVSRDPESFDHLRIAFHEVRVIETIFGPDLGTFPLLRTDTTHYERILLSPLKEGDHVLLFISIEKGDTNFAKYTDEFYTAFDDLGIFDIEDNRAFPRFPEAFEETSEAFYQQEQGDLRAFFELDKLKAAINERK